MLCVYRKLVIGFMVINSISSWFKKRVLYIFWIFWILRHSQIHVQVLQELASGKIVKLKVMLSFFFSFQQKVLHICYQAKALVQKHWHREKSFPTKTHPAFQTVVMFSEWYSKMQVTLTQHKSVPPPMGAPYRPSLVPLQCLLL